MFPSSQSTRASPEQSPASQKSLSVQGSPSSQSTGIGLKTQPSDGKHWSWVQTLPSSQKTSWRFTHPRDESQESDVQALLSSQSNTPVPAHTAPLHASPVEQMFPSSQRTFPTTGGKRQFPVKGLQESSSVQGLPSPHSFGDCPTQTPLKQLSTSVHRSPSSHTVCTSGINLQPVSSSQVFSCLLYTSDLPTTPYV